MWQNLPMGRPKNDIKRQRVAVGLLPADIARLKAVGVRRGWDLPPATVARELLREKLADELQRSRELLSP